MGYTAITHVNEKDVYSPTITVEGREVVNPNLITQPASMEVEIEDISASDAGRTADTKMHKKTLRTVYALSLSWNNLHTAQASKVLQIFNEAEYYKVRFLDPYTGTYATKTFYLGNRTVPMYSAELDVWSNISFKVVER